MIWCRFAVDGRAHYGIVENDRVEAVEGTPFGEHRRTATSHPLDAVKLLLPTKPNTFFCVGVNYRDHIIKRAAVMGRQPTFPRKPDVGYRANNALIAHEEDIVKPRDAGDEFQYEGELVAVFGKRAKNVTKEDAMNYVLGFTIGNDVSERGWQYGDATMWRGKNADTFKPMGPWIVTGLDPKDMKTTIRLNGRVTDEFATGNMIFDVPTYIAEVTKYVTIDAGDVMWMGTDGLPSNMTVGDTVEIEITGIGTLRNRVVAGGSDPRVP